jgi:thymidylate synthase (FAD)
MNADDSASRPGATHAPGSPDAADSPDGALQLRARLVAWTDRNPALTPNAAAGFSDLAALWEGKGSWPEAVVEYAGRVCYRSTARMGTAPDFIVARVREGHEDIIEHIWVTVEFSGSDAPMQWRLINRHCDISSLGDGRWLVSGNLRVWLEFFRLGIALEAAPFVRTIAPSVFDVLGHHPEAGERAEQLAATVAPVTATPFGGDAALLAPVADGQMRVTLLGFTQPVLDDPALLLHHGQATFLFEGISRTCTHQLVRHRLGSYSQESQRYVDLSKGGWTPVVPSAFDEKPEARRVLDEFWALAEEKYDELRRLGVRKEDARFLLPNAAETRIVTSMNFAGWSHFFWLRAVDKAAQWEIRIMAQHALRMLHAIAPAVFAEHWAVYLDRFAGNSGAGSTTP